MIVPNVEAVTVHFKSGKHLRFYEEEIGVQLIKTEIKNSEGTETVLVEYYMITTTPLER